jgi:hypothetical protein
MLTGISQKAMNEAFGAFPPCTMLGIELHRARWRVHLCAECMCPIGIGERYRRVVYKDNETGKLAQYKTHVVCNVEDVL